MSVRTKDQVQAALVPSARGGDNRRSVTPGTSWEQSVRHLAEMILVMMIGMVVLAVPVGAVAGALGYRDLNDQVPEVATLVMAFDMTVPMVLWMVYRGHHRRGVLEMSAVMVAPAIMLLVAAQVGLIRGPGMVSTYHVAMLATMVGYILYRRAEYLG